MGQGRGNREAWKNGVATQFNTDRTETLSKSVHVRVSESMMKRVKSIPKWQEFVRKVIQEALDELDEMDELNETDEIEA